MLYNWHFVAVSYTHLDVYKRQVEHRILFRELLQLKLLGHKSSETISALKNCQYILLWLMPP